MADRSKHAFIEQALAQRKQDNQFRELSPVHPTEKHAVVKQDGRELINFCSNDYLGLSGHSLLKERSRSYIQQYEAGSTASRLVCGSLTIHHQVEEKIASFLYRESALLFNSGFQANSTLIATLTDRHSLVLADKKCHNSLLQGALLSRATFKRFRHNDVDHLQRLLEQAADQDYNRILIVTETVFSMDGDRTAVARIAELSDKFKALLFVDDAHAVGVWGERGRGLAANIPNVDILLGTCGKAFGTFGAYVACSRKMKEYLINFCPGFIYTTALPPSVVGALDAAVSLIPQLDDRRQALHRKIEFLRHELIELGFNTGNSTTQIIPVIIGDEKETLALSKWLMEHEILASAIRPPTVAPKRSRIRLTLTAGHTQTHLTKLLQVLKSWKNA